MMKKLTGLVLCLCLAMGLLQGCGPAEDPDIYFAARTTYLLMNGDPSTKDRLDWEMLQFMGTNEGGNYMAIPSEGQKTDFKTTFVNAAPAKFQNLHIDTDKLKNWRVQSKDAWQTFIVADAPNARFLVTVTHRTGEPRIASMGMVS